MIPPQRQSVESRRQTRNEETQLSLHSPFPLTPALSLGERESLWPRKGKSSRHSTIFSHRTTETAESAGSMLLGACSAISASLPCDPKDVQWRARIAANCRRSVRQERAAGGSCLHVAGS